MPQQAGAVSFAARSSLAVPGMQMTSSDPTLLDHTHDFVAMHFVRPQSDGARAASDSAELAS